MWGVESDGVEGEGVRAEEHSPHTVHPLEAGGHKIQLVGLPLEVEGGYIQVAEQGDSMGRRERQEGERGEAIKKKINAACTM